MQEPSIQTIFDLDLTDEVSDQWFLTQQVADNIFSYFRHSVLFQWNDIHNCEDRAEAIAILLSNWKIPHYKAWAFSSYFLKNETGSLHNKWNYHVCIVLPVKDQPDQAIEWQVIDPTHSPTLMPLHEWASRITKEGVSYYFIKEGHTYIFQGGNIQKTNWHQRNKQNFKWTIQGLAGINGVSNTGKAAVAFRKKRIQKTLDRFRAIQYTAPNFYML